jgi:hypothetical protein
LGADPAEPNQFNFSPRILFLQLFTRILQKTDALVATRSWPAGNIRGGQVSISS